MTRAIAQTPSDPVKKPMSPKKAAAWERTRRLAHSKPVSEKQRAASQRTIHAAIRASALLPRSEKQKAWAKYLSQNLSKMPKTEKHLAASRENQKKMMASRAIKNGHCELCNIFCHLQKDHDHKTGKQRGKLCSNCNTGLGLFRDSPQLLREAAAYLEKHASDGKLVLFGVENASNQ